MSWASLAPFRFFKALPNQRIWTPPRERARGWAMTGRLQSYLRPVDGRSRPNLRRFFGRDMLRAHNLPRPESNHVQRRHHPFFFSSRRRHTSWTGDWSSDVCSSDLPTSPLDDQFPVIVDLAEPAAGVAAGLPPADARLHPHRPALAGTEPARDQR